LSISEIIAILIIKIMMKERRKKKEGSKAIINHAVCKTHLTRNIVLDSSYLSEECV
jgi:hypothetical protein